MKKILNGILVLLILCTGSVNMLASTTEINNNEVMVENAIDNSEIAEETIKEKDTNSNGYQAIDAVELEAKGITIIEETEDYILYSNGEFVSKLPYVNTKFQRGAGTKMIMLAHLSSINTSVGNNVNKGSQIGVMGSTGMVTGPHVHVELWDYYTTSVPHAGNRISPDGYLDVFNSGYVVTNQYDEYDPIYANNYHKGIDVVPAGWDWTVNSPTNGIVRSTVYGNQSFGNYVIIEVVDNPTYGNLELFSVSKSTISVVGWHVDGRLQGDESSYIFIMEAGGNELARIKVDKDRRDDVGAAYGGIPNSLYSGFAADIPITDNMRGKNITILHRYAATTEGENSRSDLRFGPSRSISNFQKVGSLDEFKVSDSTILVSGWHANEGLHGDESSYILIMEAGGEELARVKVDKFKREDVNAIYGTFPNSLYSGFIAEIPITDNMRGKNITVLHRYAATTEGENSRSDLRFETSRAVSNMRKESNLEEFEVSNSTILVTGWHLNNRMQGNEYSYVVITDNRGNELAKVQATKFKREDVYEAYGDMPNSLYSGFIARIPITENMYGKDVKVIHRYANSEDGSKAQSEVKFNHAKNIANVKNESNLEEFNVSNSTISVSGWHFSDKLQGDESSYIFIMEAGGEELARVKVDKFKREDVYGAYGYRPNSLYSGFIAEIPITDNMRGKNITILHRYAATTEGENSRGDVRYGPSRAVSNMRKESNLEEFEVSNSTISISGWHLNDKMQGNEYSYVIITDDRGNELAKVQATKFKREDVYEAYGDIPNSLYSGFIAEIPITDNMRGKNLKVIHRYAISEDGNKAQSEVKFGNSKKIEQ